jgi:homoaconitase/3-isopropylmalate dehydratase large subunit
VYFNADDDAQYAESFEIDLSKVESSVAKYPSPDNVVPVTEMEEYELDGTFIGACTTAEEDLIIAAMILQTGMAQGLRPIDKGRRIVVPGSKPIRHKLEKLGLIEVYKNAGFKVGVPGCSMCVGQGVDQAASGEKWLSSQNRNFKNRMGPGKCNRSLKLVLIWIRINCKFSISGHCGSIIFRDENNESKKALRCS